MQSRPRPDIIHIGAHHRDPALGLIVPHPPNANHGVRHFQAENGESPKISAESYRLLPYHRTAALLDGAKLPAGEASRDGVTPSAAASIEEAATYARQMTVIPDSDFGKRVRDRLRTEEQIWFTTTGADATPQPNPVWFLWDERDDSVLIYNATHARRLDHVAVRPRVSLNFNSDEHGDDVVVIAGVAEQALDVPPVHENDAYLQKYDAGIARIGSNREKFARDYSVPLRVRFAKVRGF